jgi:hypothetical protein
MKLAHCDKAAIDPSAELEPRRTPELAHMRRAWRSSIDLQPTGTTALSFLFASNCPEGRIFAPSRSCNIRYLVCVVGADRVRIIADWPLSDNHIYLLAYWCLALALALGGTHAESTIRRSTRQLQYWSNICEENRTN